MENTIQNKEKFFGVYMGVECRMSPEYVNVEIYIESGLCSTHDYLLLKPLSSITDEDAKEIFVIHYEEYVEGCNDIGDVRDYINEYISGRSWDYPTIFLTLINTIDYIRSKGYALPWMGLSVETLIDYGWVKLKTE